MSLHTIAVVNGLLAVGILAALAYVCRLPFRVDRFDRLDAAEDAVGEADYGRDRLAA